MDFSYSDEQLAIAELAEKILGDGASQERMRALERGEGPRFDRDLWREIAAAGLLGIAVPEEYGGAGLGFVEVAAIIEQIGRTTAPVPLLETVVLGALPLVEFGSAELKQTLLPRVVEGQAILTAALMEDGGVLDAPGTRAERKGDGFSLSGQKICVPAAQLAERILVPATDGDGAVSVFLLDPGADGVELQALDTTSGQPEALLELRGARVDGDAVLGRVGQGAEIARWIDLRANAALSALALGVCREALHLTAEYTKTRKQFDVPIATFQAVGQRAADAYIDTEAIRLTSWQASWRIAEGLPADSQVAVAKYWAAEGGQRVVHAAQHLHGGVGVDRDYPLHRYFLYSKQLELQLGGGTQQLLRLGRILATTPA